MMPRRPVTRLAGACPLIACLACPADPPCPQPWQLHDEPAGASQADAQFGWALAGIGDIDGDGYADAAIGARFFNAGPFNAAGAVFIYRGGQPAGSNWAWRLDGLSKSEHFGESIAGGHDIDGDGIADLIAGAPLRTSGTGAVDVFLGGSPFTADRWATLADGASDDWFGQSVALGDLDGDGLAEIIIGAPYNDIAANAAGAVFIYRGGPSPPSAPWRILTGENTNDHFGWSVAYLGDFDGDGYGDIAIGARLHGIGPAKARGKVYLFRGGSAMSTQPAGAWLGEAANDWFGNSVAGVGDVDGGGRADLLVGAPYNDAAGVNAGSAYLFRGEDPIGSPHAARYSATAADAQLGWAVAGAGDIDGDGLPDVLAGARLENGGAGPASGRAYLFPGGSPLQTAPIGTASGKAPDDWFGSSVGAAPGFIQPGDGAALIGAPFNDRAAPNAGLASIYTPCAQTPCPPDFNKDGKLDIEDFIAFQLGFALQLPAADFNGDGKFNIEDFIAFQLAFALGCP